MGSSGREIHPLTRIDDRAGQGVEIDHAPDGDAGIDIRAGAYGDAPQRVVRADDHRLARDHGPALATGRGAGTMAGRRPEPHEEDERDGEYENDTTPPSEPDRRGRADLSGRAHVGLPSEESNEISIEHQYELYRRAPTKFQDIFEQVFDHLAGRR